MAGYSAGSYGANHSDKAEIIFLSMINLSASDDTCVYSTLNFIPNQGQQFYLFCLIVTFTRFGGRLGSNYWKLKFYWTNATDRIETRWFSRSCEFPRLNWTPLLWSRI